MADLDPDQIAQLNDNLRLMSETMGSLTESMGSFASSINSATRGLGGINKNANDLGEDLKALGDGTEKLTAREKARLEAIAKHEEAMARLTMAFNNSKQAVIGFTDALLSGERGFGKYSQAMNAAGDAAFNLGKAFGPLGAILGGIIKGGTMLAGAFAKQADNVLKATDDLSKMGTAGQFTADEVRKMGARAGYASDQLDKLVKPIQGMGASLINLGGTAAQGAKAFSEIAAVGKDTRMQYQRLGVSQEELTQAQADYIKLQQTSGQQITKSNKELQKSSLAYVDNLLTLAALTGQDIESVKKKNELAMSEIETKIQNNLLDQEILRLKNTGSKADAERAVQLEKEKNARDKLLQRVENEVGDPALRKGLAKFLATGAITEEVAALKRIGVPIEQFASRIKKGEDVSAEFMDSLSKNGDAMMKHVGYAAMFSEETRKAFGVSDQMLEYLAKTRGKEAKEREKAIEDAKGKADKDPAQIARNKLTEAEIAAKLKVDELVASMNPLLTGFDNMDMKLKILIGAVIAATVALGALAVSAGAKGLKDMAGAAGSKLPDAVKGAGGFLSRNAGKIGAAGAVIAGGYQAYQGVKEADRALAAGEITEGVARERKQEAKYTGTGVAIGGAAGAAIGTAIAGPLGTVVGGWLGAKGGEMIGSWLAGRDDKQNPEVVASQKKAEKETINANLSKEEAAVQSKLSQENISKEEKEYYEKQLMLIKRKQLYLENEDTVAAYKAAKDPEEKAMLLAKNQRLREEISAIDKMRAVNSLNEKSTEKDRENALKKLNQATETETQVKIQRLNQELQKTSDEEKRKAILAQIEQAKKEKDEILKKNAEFVAGAGKDKKPGDTGTAEVKPAIDEATALNWAYSVYINACTLADVPAPYVEKVKSILANPPPTWSKAPAEVREVKESAPPTPDTKPADAATTPTPTAPTAPTAYEKILIAGKEVSKDVPLTQEQKNMIKIALASGDKYPQWIMDKFAGGFAEGGTIPSGKFGLVGEKGPELISGPAGVTSNKETQAWLAKNKIDLSKVNAENQEEVKKVTKDVYKAFIKEFEPIQKYFTTEFPEGLVDAALKAEKMMRNNDEEWRKLTDDEKLTVEENIKVYKEYGMTMRKEAKSYQQIMDEQKKILDLLDSKDPNAAKAIEKSLKTIDELEKTIASGNIEDAFALVNETTQGILQSSSGLAGTSGVAATSRGGARGGGASGGAAPVREVYSGGTSQGGGGGGGTQVVKGDSDYGSFGGTTATPQASDFGVPTKPGPDTKVLDFIGKLESAGNYNILVGGKTKTNPSLTDMTVGQILEFQKSMLKAGHESTAVGKYQIIRGTLQGLIKQGVVSPDQKFDQSTQDRAAIGLLNVRGREKFKSGGLSTDSYANNLAKEWASLPMPDGRSFYAGVGSNKAHASRESFVGALQAKTGGMVDGPESGFPAILHGKEMIVPLNPSSILAELGKKTKEQAEIESVSKTSSNGINNLIDTNMKEMVSLNKNIAEILETKLDRMLEKLDNSVEVQDKILKYSQA